MHTSKDAQIFVSNFAVSTPWRIATGDSMALGSKTLGKINDEAFPSRDIYLSPLLSGVMF